MKCKRGANPGKDVFYSQTIKREVKGQQSGWKQTCHEATLEYKFIWESLGRSDHYVELERAAVHAYYHLVSPLAADRLEDSHWGLQEDISKKEYFTFCEMQNKTEMTVGPEPRIPELRNNQTQTLNSCVISFKLPNFTPLWVSYL